MAEYATAFSAPRWYFRTGLPVIRKRFDRTDLTAEQLGERILRKAPHRLVLRQSGIRELGLRENFLFYLLYSALLHWQLLPSKTGRGWVLVGRYKVYAVVLGMMFVTRLFEDVPDLLALPFLGLLAVITGIIVMIQRWQVRCLYGILAGEKST